VYGVSDYWFVNDEVHFKAVGDGGVPSGEQVIGAIAGCAENQRHEYGAGISRSDADAPWEKYLKDHPDLTPPRWWPGGKGIKTKRDSLCASGPLAGSEAEEKASAGFVRNDGGQSIAITKKVKIRAVEK